LDIGIYTRGLNNLPDVEQIPIDFIAFGDYGCPNIIPKTAEIIEFKNRLATRNIELHYISPKVNQAVINKEYDRVLSLMDEGISISINDWGLLFKLKKQITFKNNIYIGRLLTKSVFNWAWSNISFAKENRSEIDYLVQNNFNHKQKIDYFKQWNIKGIEANAYIAGEPSYRRIKEQGFEIIGFIDNIILSVARACPIARLKGINMYVDQCRGFCQDEVIEVITADDRQKAIYPQMELRGNVLYRPQNLSFSWHGYKKLVFQWRKEKEHQLIGNIINLKSFCEGKGAPNGSNY
jgi:hypothetical protein